MPNIEALTQLRRVVEDAPDDLFWMNRVVHNHACGTARCAFGWALVDPWFLKNTHIRDSVVQNHDGTVRVRGSTFSVLAEIFGINELDSDRLFGAKLHLGSSDTPKREVLKNIDRLITGKPALPYAAILKE